MSWILIIIITAGHGVSMDHITLHSENDCKEASNNIKQINKELGFGERIKSYCAKVASE